MATNPQAAGQTTITFQISEEEKAELQKLAAASKMKLSAYIRLVLAEALAEKFVYAPTRMTEHARTATPRLNWLMEESATPPPPAPKKKFAEGKKGK